MIIQQEVSAPVITSIGAAPSKFKIKASAKAFKILSGFYSEPILAIPRELGANAWDAHVKAGNTKQTFEVHAPNSLEPWFSIRDFGTGLSPEDIDQIYTTYFESTKTSDNDSDGCMGLGSKTPFNYTENFTVTSYFKGTKYVYNCFIDESGSPNILPVANEPTTAHNGLEIKFGVKMGDIGMWVEKITRAYEPFRFRPTITGAVITFKPREYVFQGKNWAMRKAEDRYNRGTCRAFMGNYSYPINYESIRGYVQENYKDDTSNKLYSMLNSGCFDFFFNIGDLEVAPNKEQLQYDGDHKTAKAITEAAILGRSELHTQVTASLKVPATLWEAMSLYIKYNAYNGELSNVRSVIGNIEIIFKGKKIESGNLSVDNVNIELGFAKKDPANPYSNVMPHKFSVGVLHYRESSDKFVVRDRGYYQVTEKGDVPVFLYTSEEALKKARVRHYLKTTYPNGDIPDAMLVIDQSPNFKFFKAHCAHLGIPDKKCVNIEDLPKPPRVPREAKTATTNEINYVNMDSVDVTPGRYHNSIYWMKKANTFDAKETYYYVDFYYTDPVWKSKDISDNMDGIIRYLKSHKVLPATATTIWGINKKNSFLLKTGKWVNVVELAEKAILKNRVELEHNLYLLTLNESLSRLANIRRLITDYNLLEKIDNKETVKKLKGLIQLNKAVQNISTDANPLCAMFGITAKLNTPLEIDLSTFEKELDSKYLGIFTMFDHYAVNATKLAKLINFIDEKS